MATYIFERPVTSYETAYIDADTREAAEQKLAEQDGEFEMADDYSEAGPFQFVEVDSDK